MMMLEINEETSQTVCLNLEMVLPKWKVLILEKRAQALHQGDMGKCLAQIFDVGFHTEIKFLGGIKKDSAINN
ncbi:MAG: hypothetical protein P8168_09125 [Deltaproteobacteria bacterium]|jgi:hypothetical protein